MRGSIDVVGLAVHDQVVDGDCQKDHVGAVWMSLVAHADILSGCDCPSQCSFVAAHLVIVPSLSLLLAVWM